MNILKQVYFQQPRGSAHKKAFAESRTLSEKTKFFDRVKKVP